MEGGGIGETEGPSRTFDALARALATALPVPLTLITLGGRGGQDVVGLYASQLSADRARGIVSATPLCRQVVLSAKPVIVHDLSRRVAAGSHVLAPLDVAGYAAVPIVVGGAAVGAVAAFDHHVRAWSDRDVELLRQFADAVAVLAGAGAALERERALNAMLLRSAGASTLEELLEGLAKHTGWPCAEVVTIQDGRVRTLASYDGGRPDGNRLGGRPGRVDVDPLVRDALLSGQPTWHSDLEGRAGYCHAFAIAIPDSSAVLELFTDDVSPNRSDIARVARSVAALAGSVLLRTTPRDNPDRRTGELEILALHDELTGLLNRRGFYAVAGGQLAIARRKAMAGIVLFIDVDGLKDVNDRGGHSAGDTLLRLAAGVLRSTFREADTIGRVGGDEFVVFSIDATDQDLDAVTERLSSELARVNVLLAPAPILRWSVGFVSFEGQGVESLDSLMVEADRRMYEIKRSGRASTASQLA